MISINFFTESENYVPYEIFICERVCAPLQAKENCSHFTSRDLQTFCKTGVQKSSYLSSPRRNRFTVLNCQSERNTSSLKDWKISKRMLPWQSIITTSTSLTGRKHRAYTSRLTVRRQFYQKQNLDKLISKQYIECS